MNACEIEFAKSISSSDDNQRRLIKEQIGEKMYNELMAGGSNSASSNSNLSLRDFFDFGNGRNGSLYERTRSMTISKIKAKLFNDYENPNGFVATTDKQLDLAFKSLISSLKSKRGYRENPNQKVWDLYKILDDPSYRNPDFISDYFIINHLDIVINNWMKDLISKRGNNFIYKPKHEIRVDWDSDKFDKKEPDLSALVSSLLRDTIVNKYVGNKVVKGKFFITQTSFMTAASIIFNQLDYKTMQEVVENPYKIIDVLKKRYSNNKSWPLEDNILRSFCEKWLFKNDEDQFFLASFKNNNKYVQILFSPLDVFVHSFSKYVVNTYLDYDVENGKITKLSTSVDTGDLTSDIYVQICSNIELSDLSAYDKLFKKNNTKFDVADISEIHNFKKQISKQAKHQLDSLLGIDITNFEQANMILHAIADYHNSNGKNTFQDFIKDWRPSARIKTNESPTTFIRDAVKLEYASNPTIILGSKKNVTGTSLPTFGIESLASDIRKAVAINDLHKRQIGFNGKTIYEHGFLYKEITEDTGMFKGTNYPDIIFVDGVSKETSNLSTYEAFKMAFVYNWYNGWHSEEGSFYIQAITPSDKPKIPWFEFDAKKFKDKFTSNGKLNKAMIMSQLHLMYKQYLLNSINDFSRVLGFKTFDQDAANVNLEDIKNRIIEINALKLSVDDINNKVNDYNRINNSNIIIAQHADYVKNKNGAISFNNFILEYVENTNDESYYLSNFLNDLKDLSKDMPYISWMYKNEEHSLDFEKLSKYDIETLRKEIKNNKDLSSLYDYFLIQCLCSDNILANTVGFQFQHKNVKEGFKDNDSQSHITMVKRMVAMTATAHNMMPGVLSGQPDQMRMMVIKNGQKEMITHSGKSTSGDNPIDELKISDGVMYSTRISDTLSKQSIADVKPYGNAIKYICHDYRVDKGGSTLLKLASDSIDNAYLRQFSYGNLSDSDPLSIIKLQLEDGHIKPEISVAGDKIIGINGAPVALFRHRYKKNGVIYTVSNLRFINNRFYVTVQASNRDGAYEESCDNNL